MSGILYNDRIIPITGVRVLPPASRGGPSWCFLSPRDYSVRHRPPIQVLLHTSKGDGPMSLLPGTGGGGQARRMAEFWQDDPTPSGAHLVVDDDGTVACLADLAQACAFHATVSNQLSVGIEMYQASDNGVREATYQSAVLLVTALCEILDIPFYVVSDTYTGHPLPRFLDGGPTYHGVLGHRHNTEQRGRFDPGDEIFSRLVAAGGEAIQAGVGEDLERSRRRQLWLNSRGEALAVDGVAGPASMAAMRRRGLTLWSQVPMVGGQS